MRMVRMLCMVRLVRMVRMVRMMRMMRMVRLVRMVRIVRLGVWNDQGVAGDQTREAPAGGTRMGGEAGIGATGDVGE